MSNIVVSFKKDMDVAVDGKQKRGPSDGKSKPREELSPTEIGMRALGVQLVGFAKEALMVGINNYGALTGDTRTQKQIQTAIGLAGMIATAGALGPIAGAGYIGFKVGMEAINVSVANRIERRESEFKIARLGRIIEDGGR